ncbi:MAG: ATP-binding cassette domain-containing protein [Alkaliphilus sp.]
MRANRFDILDDNFFGPGSNGDERILEFCNERENIVMGGFYEDISEITKMFNLDCSSGRNIKNLSGGEAKRINICRGLMSEKHILFADEPTASLDEANSARVMNKLLNSSNTVVVVTHDLNQLKYFDSVYEIRECKVWKRK